MPDDTTATRTCIKCGRELPATAEFFYKRKDGKSGLRSDCKDCRKAKSRDYCAVHSEENKARCRAYQAAHREEQAAYRAAHHEERATKTKAWWKAHPDYAAAHYVAHHEEKAAYGAAYYAAHREETNIRGRTYYAAHPELFIAYSRNRRARESGADGTHDAEDVKAQYDRQKGKCFYCHKKVGDKYHVDHVVPLTLGGSNGPENLVVSCPKCNKTKGAKHPMDFCGILL